MNNDYYCGLNNHGNTCFFNSAIQSLMRCSVFVNFIANLHIDHELIKIFQDFIKEYKQNANKAISPMKLVRYYTKLNRRYHIGNQDDAHEVITYFVDEISEIIKKEIKERPENNVVIKGDIKMENMMEYLFGVVTKTTIKCLKCNHKSESKSTEFQLSLAIKHDNIEDALENFSTIEELNGDNQYHCEKCKTKVDALKCDTIIRTPKYLHVQLKRFENNGRRLSKINDEVKVKSNLVINENEYKLRGIVHHMGSINGGHYIYHYNKDKRDDNKNWLCLNDSGISSKDVGSEINHGYVYLYVK